MRFLQGFESQTRSNCLLLSHIRSSIRAQPVAASPVDEVDDVITEQQLPTRMRRSLLGLRKQLAARADVPTLQNANFA
jgi:hypothetical protein